MRVVSIIIEHTNDKFTVHEMLSNYVENQIGKKIYINMVKKLLIELTKERASQFSAKIIQPSNVAHFTPLPNDEFEAERHLGQPTSTASKSQVGLQHHYDQRHLSITTTALFSAAK